MYLGLGPEMEMEMEMMERATDMRAARSTQHLLSTAGANDGTGSGNSSYRKALLNGSIKA